MSYSTSTSDFNIEGLGTTLSMSMATGLPGDKSAFLLRDSSSNFLLKIYDSQGGQIGSAINILNKADYESTTKTANAVKILGLSNGNILVQYNKTDSSAPGSSDAYFFILNQSGIEVVTDTKINTFTGGGSLTREVDITELSNGDIAFAYQRNDNSSRATRVFNNDGTAASAEVNVQLGITGSQNSIAANSGGGYILAYEYNSSGLNYITYKVYNNDAVLQKTGALLSGTGGNSPGYELLGLTNGTYLAVTTAYGDSTGTGRIINASGDITSTISLAAAYTGTIAAIKTTGSEGFVIQSTSNSNTAVGTSDWIGTTAVTFKAYDNSGTLVSTTPSVSVDKYYYGGATQPYPSLPSYISYTHSYSPSYVLYAGFERGAGLMKYTHPNLPTTSSGSPDGQATIGAMLFDQGSPAPTVTLSVNNGNIAEAAGTATITATLSAIAASDTTVTLSTSGTAAGGGTDYTLSNSTITIAAGQTTGTATITAVQDALDEANETVIVDIASVSGGGGANENGTQQLTTTITDDDAAPTVSIANVSQAEGNSGTSTMTFTATLSAASGITVTVNYGTSNGTASTAGSDYTAATGTLTFNPGETSKTFTVTIQGDTTVETSETFTATLSAPGNATLGTATATGTITNDDAPFVSGVSSSKANGSYKVGEVINIQVNFNEAVTVTGTPQLTLETGATDRIVNYASGSGSSTLVFSYTVQAGDTSFDLDYAGTTALALSGGNIVSTSNGLAATLTLATPGAANSLGNNQAIVIDTTAPNGPSTPDLSVSSDSGTSSIDNITQTTTPTFTGTAEANATVKLYDSDGTTELGSATADGSGNWSVASSALSSGAHTVTVKATDAAGNVSAASVGLAITIDTTAPTASVTAGTIGVGAAVMTSRSTETGTVYLVKDGSNVANLAALEADVSGGTARKASVAAANTNTSIDTTGLAVGSYHVYSVDAAGNVSAASANAISLANGPSITVSTAAFSADSGTSSTDFITKMASQTISGTLSGNTAADEYVEVSLDNGGTWVTADNTIGTNTWSLASQTLTVSNTLQVRVTNTVCSSASLSQAYVLDTTAPTTTVATKAFSADTGTSSTDFITQNAAQAISGTLSAVTVAGEFVQVSLDNGSTWTTATNVIGQNTWSLAGQMLAGSDTLHVRVTDAAGNSGTDATQAYVLDSSAPVAIVTTVTVAVGSNVTTNQSTEMGRVYLVKDGASAASLAALEADVTANTASKATIATANADTAIDTTGLAAGTYHTYAVDVAGNVSAQSANAVTLANAPSITVATTAFSADTGSNSTDLITNTAAQNISGTLSGVTSAGESVEVSLDNGTTWVTATNTTGTNTWSLDGQILTASDTLQARVTNAVGNSTALSQAYVLDTTAPNVSSITLADTALTIGETSGATITFSEAVTGFTNADLSIANGTLSSVSSADGGVTWTATFTPTANLVATTNVITLDKAGVTDKAGNAGSGTAISANYTVVTAKTLAYSTASFAEAAANDGSITATSTLTLTNDTFTGANGASLGSVTNVPAGLAASLVKVDATHATLSFTGQATAHANANDVANLTVTFANGDFIGGSAANVAGATTNNLVIDFADPASSAPSTPTVNDNDGVPETVEKAVPSLPSASGGSVAGDGNGDGVADSQQSNVTSVAFRQTEQVSQNPNASPVYVTLVADATSSGTAQSGSQAALNNVRQLDAPADKPSKLEFPLGLIDFTSTAAQSGATERFSLFVDRSVAVNGYWKQDNTGTWVNIASKIDYVGGKALVNFSIQDGGIFDADGVANGKIVDPGGLGSMARTTASLGDLLAGLYAAYYDRAPDADGLAYWKAKLTSGTMTFTDISSGFAQHPRFVQEYASLTHQQTVEKLYSNLLGQNGDAAGIAFWTGQLDHGRGVADLIADFVSASLNADLFAARQNAQLTDAEYSLAYQRQTLLDNKVKTALNFVDLFGATTVPRGAATELASDNAYKAAIQVIEGITSDPASAYGLSAQLVKLVATPDPMQAIVNLSY
jgi:hypothetical protein